MVLNKQALKAINTATVAAGGVTLSPLPFSDSAMLIPVQTTMVMQIYKAYGKSISKGTLKGILTATTTSVLGRTLSGNLLKFIPGVGTIGGLVINGGVAVSLTKAIGTAVADGLEKDEIDTTNDLIQAITATLLLFK